MATDSRMGPAPVATLQRMLRDAELGSVERRAYEKLLRSNACWGDADHLPYAKCVGMIEFTGVEDGKMQKCSGTAFLVGPTTIMTNAHNVRVSHTDTRLHSEFGHIEVKFGDDGSGCSVRLDPSSIKYDDRLDVAIAKVAALYLDRVKIHTRKFGWFTVPQDPDDEHRLLGKLVGMVGFPGRRDCRLTFAHPRPVAAVTRDTIQHTCDTTEGNSGSPLLFVKEDGSVTLVGIHHSASTVKPHNNASTMTAVVRWLKSLPGISGYGVFQVSRVSTRPMPRAGPRRGRSLTLVIDVSGSMASKAMSTAASITGSAVGAIGGGLFGTFKMLTLSGNPVSGARNGVSAVRGAKTRYGQVKLAVGKALQQQTLDQVNIITFNHEVSEPVPLAGGPMVHEHAVRHLDSMSPGGATALYRAMLVGCCHVGADPYSENGMMALTDGADNRSTAEEKRKCRNLCKLMQSSDVANALKTVVVGILDPSDRAEKAGFEEVLTTTGSDGEIVPPVTLNVLTLVEILLRLLALLFK